MHTRRYRYPVTLFSRLTQNTRNCSSRTRTWPKAAVMCASQVFNRTELLRRGDWSSLWQIEPWQDSNLSRCRVPGPNRRINPTETFPEREERVSGVTYHQEEWLHLQHVADSLIQQVEPVRSRCLRVWHQNYDVAQLLITSRLREFNW